MKPTTTTTTAIMAAILLAGPFVAPSTLSHGYHDGDYHEVILFEWDTAQLDVIINLPVMPHALWRIEATERSIDAWQDGIQAFGPTWLANGIDIDHYTVGLDVIPPEAAADPEIIVTSAEPGVIGIGIETDFLCPVSPSTDRNTDGPALPGGLSLDDIDVLHQHDGSPWLVGTAKCGPALENVCFVINTNWETYQNGLYDLNAHEYGHCLGIGHVGDAGDFHATTFPSTDIMSYQHDPDQVHCVSNLNVMAVQATFANVLDGQAPRLYYPGWDPGFAYVRVSVSSYEQVPCSNPPAAPLDFDWFPV